MDDAYWSLTFADTLMAAPSIAIAFFSYGLLKVNEQLRDINERLNWFVGSQESHSETMVRLEARKQGVPVVWWDFSEHGRPARYDGHEDRMPLIRVGLPPTQRKRPPAWVVRERQKAERAERAERIRSIAAGHRSTGRTR